MTKKHEELVGEIPVREITDLEMSIAQHLQKFSYQKRSLPYCLDYTELLLALMGKAYADGELELPGEVGRDIEEEEGCQLTKKE